MGDVKMVLYWGGSSSSNGVGFFGCGLFFFFQLRKPYAIPVVFHLTYHLLDNLSLRKMSF